MYAKIFGTIRAYKEEKGIVGTHIKKVEKFEEMTNHLLQVFVANQMRLKGILSVSFALFLINFCSNKTSWMIKLANKQL